MAENSPIPTYIVVIFIISPLISTIGNSKPCSVPLSHYNKFPALDIAGKLLADPESLTSASTDFGHIVKENPIAVLYPSSTQDILSLIKEAYNSSVPFGIAARGNGHSTRGQAMAHVGVVVEMSALKNHQNGSRVAISGDNFSGFYADVGGEQLWIDVLKATLEHGLTPVSFTDYLYLTVGGTLSNAGISGQAFRYGPQIANVYEMDVVTGIINSLFSAELASATKNYKLIFVVYINALTINVEFQF